MRRQATEIAAAVPARWPALALAPGRPRAESLADALVKAYQTSPLLEVEPRRAAQPRRERAAGAGRSAGRRSASACRRSSQTNVVEDFGRPAQPRCRRR